MLLYIIYKLLFLHASNNVKPVHFVKSLLFLSSCTTDAAIRMLYIMKWFCSLTASSQICSTASQVCIRIVCSMDSNYMITEVCSRVACDVMWCDV